MLSHGTAPVSLLLSSMVPLIRSKRGCKCDFNNNITITINRLLGKIFHTVLLKLQHASLFTLNPTHFHYYARTFFETLFNITMKMAATVTNYF